LKAFHYISARTVAEACDLLVEHGAGARVLAGGTDLLIELRRGSKQAPRLVLDISSIVELAGITEAEGSITIGPLATAADLMRSAAVRRFAPLLADAAATIGSPQIQSRATVGGNIMNAATCADTVPPLVALDAAVTLQSIAGRRDLPLADLFLKPYETQARPDELLTAVHFPKLGPAARSAFIKLGRRNALAISRLSVAVILERRKDGRIAEARIVPGAAFPKWQRVTQAEQMLIGKQPSEKLFAAAGKRVAEEMIKITGRRWSTEYKEPAIAVLVRRALEQCAGRPGSTARSPQSSSSASSFSCSSSESSTSTRAMTRTMVDRELRSADSGRSLRLPAEDYVLSTTINGQGRVLTVPANLTLLELLRDQLGLTGTKCGCEIGECGACTVLLDGQPVNSCLVLAPQIEGREVVTVEGLVRDGKLHPLQDAFLDHAAVHCGFCTPGMLMSAKALLDGNPRPTEAEIRQAIAGNLCRCTGYQQIVDAIANAAKQPA
jgi:xanthine dehydrogenase iron-sulfur cluster and FAD-binding subunit A